ncbi:MAG: ROK family protein, partial [Betaproteobacteria bacterium]|nr:ROK family protein [Betaproteobacteria bacterium]
APLIVGAMRAGDAIARASVVRYCDRLARALAHVINLLDPEIIVLGGGMSNVNELYAEVPRRWGSWVFSDVVRTRLVPAFHGDSSGVRGAAWLWRHG